MTEPFIIRSLLKSHIKWLVSKGCKVYVMCSDGDDISWIESQGAKVFKISIRRQPSILRDIKCLIEMILVLKKLNPDIVHYSTPKSSLITPLAIKFSFIKAKSVYTVRGRVYENKSYIIKSIFKKIEKFSCKTANKVIFISAEMQTDFIKDKLVKKEKSILIGSGSSNGFDTSIFRKPSEVELNDSKKVFGIPKNKTIISFVGRLTKDKGVEDLFYIISELSKKYSSISFLLVGKKEIDIENVLNTFSIDRDKIFFHDWTPEIQKAYWASDIMVFPSFREGFGNVCIESILCGVPVICYDVIGCRESVKNNISGYLVPFRDKQAIIDKVSFIHENESVKNQLIYKGSLWAAKEFNQTLIWNGIFKIYNDLLLHD